MKLLKGDLVQIMMGKDKGKTGKIEKVFPATNMVIVEGLNQFKRHIKSKAQGQKSEIVTISKPLYASKVSFIDPKKKKPTRISYKIIEGKKIRIATKSGEKI